MKKYLYLWNTCLVMYKVPLWLSTSTSFNQNNHNPSHSVIQSLERGLDKGIQNHRQNSKSIKFKKLCEYCKRSFIGLAAHQRNCKQKKIMEAIVELPTMTNQLQSVTSQCSTMANQFSINLPTLGTQNETILQRGQNYLVYFAKLWKQGKKRDTWLERARSNLLNSKFTPF